MPIYDRMCTNEECKELLLECYEKISFEDVVPCQKCGTATRRAILSGRTHNVIGDDIPGGIEIRHGLCNEDGTPRRYYSKSEMAKEAARRGLVNRVEHTTAPGTDKNKNTTRWI